MNIYFQSKAYLKQARWKLRRRSAALRWGVEALNRTPVILGNAMPKSGSHLISQALQGLPLIGPAVNPGFPPLNRTEDNRKLGQQETLNNIMRMLPGDIGYGYIHAEEPFLSPLKNNGRASIFVYRDPRDVIISHVFYASDINPGHGMHKHYTENLESIEARINAAILGVLKPEFQLAPIREKYGHYLGWLEEPHVLCVRFEDLILDRQTTLNSILDYLSSRGFAMHVDRSVAVDVLENAIEPRKSGTFRKAQPGNWSSYFTEANKRIFKDSTGDLLQFLGYELNDDW